MYIIHNNTAKCVYFFKYNFYLQSVCIYIFIHHAHIPPPICFPLSDVSGSGGQGC